MDAAQLIDRKIASLRDWRGEVLRTIRDLIRLVDPGIIEEWKWMGTPVWNHAGIVCCADAHTRVVKMTFPKGARLADPRRIFNAELGGNARRAITWSQGDAIDVEGVKGLVRAAIALNELKPAARKPDARSSVTGTLPGAKGQAVKRPVAKRKRKGG